MKRRWKRWLKRFLRDNVLFLVALLDIVLLGFLAMFLIWLFTPAKVSAMGAVEIETVEEEPEPIEEDTETEELCGCWEVYEMTDEELAEEEYWDSLELLALCVEAEAGSQSLLGKRLVVDVILNRVDSPDWPDTIAEVIADPYEFSTYWNGAIDSVWEASEETYQAVVMELEERSYTTIYYFSAGGYSEYGTPWMQLEDHYFSTK
ncbi:MAG: cell wall hydrolase [Lachnospiraceae bacterium]|nr:cell wall hydrolase [Lachnospiraceae bacterium]